MLHEFAVDLQKQIDIRITNLSNDLASGCAKDHADYRRITGAIGEIKAFKAVIRERLHRLINDNDDEDENTNG